MFPTSKYALLVERLFSAGLVGQGEFMTPDTAPWADLGLVHTADYLERLKSGPFGVAELAHLEVP